MRYMEEYWNDVALVVKHIPNVKKIFGSKILITGATGLVCSAVVEILFWLNFQMDAGIAIYLGGRDRERLMKRFSIFKEGNDYFFVFYDATKKNSLEIDFDYIIHGASNADPVSLVHQPVETILGNIIGLNELLELSVNKGVKRLLYISSSEVYGKKEKDSSYVEDDYGFIDVLNTRSCYPNAKRTAENLCISYAQEYGVDVAIVRPGHIYGPAILSSDSRVPAQFTRNAINGECIIMKSAGAQIRSYCYTLDCASAIVTVLINGENKAAYNISNKNSVVSIRTLAEAFAKYGKTEIVYENPSDAELKGYSTMSNSSLNAEKLEFLGWKACFNLEEGVARTLKYY